MSFIQAFRMALKSILSNKVRSILTMLGVIIGVGAVIAAVAFAQGSTKNVTDQLQSLGTNLITINITGRNSNRNVTYEQLQDFSDENKDKITAIAPIISGKATVKYEDKSVSTNLYGTSQEYEIIKDLHVTSGRFLLSFDTDYRQKVVLLGTPVVKELFENEDPLDKSVKINGATFKVVGILEEKDGGETSSGDDQIIIPVNTAQRLMRSAMISNFSVQASTPEVVDTVVDDLTAFLTKIYNSTKLFRVFNQAEAISTLNSVTGSMMLILGGIATISLVVGGIGIMNIMLVSVTERTREIGIRKAIGAKKKNILVQFLIEALMVTGIGGIIGVLLGASVIHFVIGGWKKMPEVYSVPWISLSFSISLVVGVVFGMFPAFKAANLNPIEALRHE